jgi:hypothetical protein
MHSGGWLDVRGGELLDRLRVFDAESEDTTVTGITEFEREQKEICKRYNCEFVSSPKDSILGVALSTLGRTPINGLRHPAVKGTNGWYIWCGQEFSDNPDFFSPLHTAHLRNKCPQVVPFLGLPPGYRFLIDDNYADVWLDPGLLKL